MQDYPAYSPLDDEEDIAAERAMVEAEAEEPFPYTMARR